MTDEERMMFRLKELLLDDYNSLICEMNERFNDGIHMDEVNDVYIGEGDGKLPYITFSLEQGDYTEKDRIIRNTVYVLKVRLYPRTDDWQLQARYRAALQELVRMHETDEAWEWLKGTCFKGWECRLRVTG